MDYAYIYIYRYVYKDGQTGGQTRGRTGRGRTDRNTDRRAATQATGPICVQTGGRTGGRTDRRSRRRPPLKKKNRFHDGPALDKRTPVVGSVAKVWPRGGMSSSSVHFSRLLSPVFKLLPLSAKMLCFPMIFHHFSFKNNVLPGVPFCRGAPGRGDTGAEGDARQNIVFKRKNDEKSLENIAF